jgi:hypothetical protein
MGFDMVGLAVSSLMVVGPLCARQGFSPGGPVFAAAIVGLPCLDHDRAAKGWQSRELTARLASDDKNRRS